MPVDRLRLKNVGPFEKIEFEFDPRVNILVGPNNCGKTTALLALADILLLTIRLPEKLIPERAKILDGDPDSPGKPVRRGTYETWYRDSLGQAFRTQGSLPVSAALKRDVRSRRKEKRPLGDQTDVFFEPWNCLGYVTFIPALRLSTDFRSPGPRPPGEKSPKRGEDPNEYYLRHAMAREYELRKWGPDEPASWVRDAAIIQQFVELDYRAYREHKQAIRDVIDRVVQLASDITEAFPIRFAGVGEDKDGYFPQFNTPDGRVPLNVLSQGTQSLIQWCAQFVIGYAEYYDFPESLNDKPAILIVDEIDAHLHPSWQRRILPTLAREFPALQVFCSTHSPLALAGLKAGQIHLLTRDAKGKVTVSRNTSDIVGWSADEIYTQFLGVEPTDLATTEKLDRLRALREKSTKLTPQEQTELDLLREQVQAGLASLAVTEGAQVLAKELIRASRAVPSSVHPRVPSKKPKNSSNPSSKKAGTKRRRRGD